MGTAQSAELAKRLERLGLSPYEARAYIALVAHGYGDAELIARTAQIPRTSSYKILESLQSKGFALETRGRPRIFKPEPPALLKQRFTDEVRVTFDALEELYETIQEKGEPQLIYAIMGKERVLAKIGEMLDKATKSFMISTPVFDELSERLEKRLENAVRRGVAISVITEPGQRVPPGVGFVKRSGLIATDVVADSSMALITAPDLSACGYTDNALLAAHLGQFLRILIEKQ